MTLIPTLLTGRLRLRAPILADFEAYAAMWADERTTRFIGGSPRDTNTSWLRFIGVQGLWDFMGYGYWTFADRQSDAFVGMGGLSYFARGVPQLEGVAEAGWTIAPDYWGNGLVSEAMQAVIDWSDAERGGQEIRCIIDNGNAASERVAQKLGFAGMGMAMLGDKPVNVYARPARR